MTASLFLTHQKLDGEKEKTEEKEIPGVEAGDYEKDEELDLERVGDSPVIPNKEL